MTHITAFILFTESDKVPPDEIFEGTIWSDDDSDDGDAGDGIHGDGSESPF